MLLAGGIRDEQTAAALARAGARPGDVFDLDDELEPIAAGLGEVVRVDVPIEVPGATWVHPRTLSSVRPGTQVTVFARMASPARTVAVTIGGSRRTAEAIQATPALLERAAARAEIDELEAALARGDRRGGERKLRKRDRAALGRGARGVLAGHDARARHRRRLRALRHRSQGARRHPRGRPARPRAGAPHVRRIGRRAEGRAPQQAAGAADARGAARAGAPQRSPDATGSAALAAGGRFGTIGHGSGDGLAAWRRRQRRHRRQHGQRRQLRQRRQFRQRGSFGSDGDALSRRDGAGGQPGHALGDGGLLDKSIIRRYIKRHIAKIAYCYERELLARPQLQGTLQVRFTIAPTGNVVAVTATGVDEGVAACVADVIRNIVFPSVSDTAVVVNYPFTFRAAGAPAEAPPRPRPGARPPPPASRRPPLPPRRPPRPRRRPPRPRHPGAPTDRGARGGGPAAACPRRRPAQDGPSFGPPASALGGKLARVMTAIARQDAPGALAHAKTWRDEQPTDVLALVGLGEALEASRDRAAAARAYGSIIDLYPTRADLRRFAGERL